MSDFGIKNVGSKCQQTAQKMSDVQNRKWWILMKKMVEGINMPIQRQKQARKGFFDG